MVEADEEGLEYNLGIGIRWEIPSDMSEAGIYVVNNTTEMVGGADPEANPIPGFGRSLDYAGVGRRMLRPSTWQTYDENNVRQSHRTMKLSPVETWNA